MADYKKLKASSSLHSSPNRKRTREILTTRPSPYLLSCKTAATTTSNVEVMESLQSETPILSPSITQPRSSIQSVQNGCSSSDSAENHTSRSTNPMEKTPDQFPFVVSKLQCRFSMTF